VSIVLSFTLVGWTVRENRVHQRELAAAVVERDKPVNKFLRTEVCDRLRIRDEIQINYLQAAARQWRPIDPAYSEVLQNAAQALEFTKEGCTSELPD